VYGAQLFDGQASELDAACREIALNHHERWDGLGFPGPLANLNDPGSLDGPGKRGEEIPLMARIVTLADVHDTLHSARGQEEAWSEDQVMEYLANEKGKAFDPQVLEAFLAIREVAQSIRDRYPEQA
jgi:response regulator RpfG family c-di-GMP phosphodiesterase